MIVLTASKTETCTMAIILTVKGGAGMRDTTSAAFAFASVTMSAWTTGAPARITTARPPIAGLMSPRMFFMSPAPFERVGGVRLVHVQPEAAPDFET